MGVSELTGKGGGGDLLVFYGTDYRGSIVSLTYKEIFDIMCFFHGAT